ncbi:MAG: L,D-transpeptidase family protein [Woeseiaceae bacterium]
MRTFTHCLLLVLTAMSAESAADNLVMGDALLLRLEILGEAEKPAIDDTEIVSAELLADIYSELDFEPVWSDAERIERWLGIIDAARDDGFDAVDFHYNAVRGIRAELLSGKAIPPERRAEIDLIVTDSLIRLAYSENFGKINPYELDTRWNYRRENRNDSAAEALANLLRAASPGDELQQYMVRPPFYKALRAAYIEYRDIVADGGWPEVPAGNTIRPGDSDPRIPVIAERLEITGDIDDAGLVADTFDDRLEVGVRRFQARHSLTADGVIGPGTLAAMNVPASERLETIRINLERLRWLADDFEDDMVIVNIAGFEAYLLKGGEAIWGTRVQVGRTYRQTPIFRDEITYLSINPTWTAPHSLATRDVLPRIQADPSYVVERGFDVRDRNGNNVDPATIDWDSLSRNNFPYTLVQRPGPYNAMGQVKFMFPNGYSVYLHDTPSRYLFEREARAFSAGCIRTERPFELAELLLGPQGWDQARIQEVLDSGKLTNVVLETPMPVLLTYFTARVNDDGTLVFFPDVYDRDKHVAAGLAAPFRFEPPAD